MRYLFSLLAILVSTLSLTGPARADDSADEALARQIAHQLKVSGQLKGYQIGIKTKNGTAWLAGRVTSAHQQKAALNIARKTPGVRQVINRLTLPGKAEVREAQAVAGKGPAPHSNAMAEFGAEDSAHHDALPRFPETDPSHGQGPAGTLAAIHAHPRRARGVPLGSPIAQGTPSMVGMGAAPMAPLPTASRVSRARFDEPVMPAYAWPSYASYPNYAALTYPTQYSPTAWPYIGPFYPYPQVPLGWRKVTLEWDDGWWFLDFKD
jgi:hypothetical protein